MRRQAQGFILFPAHEHICSTKASLNSRLSVDKCLLATGSRNDKHPKHRKLFEVYYRNNRNGSTKPALVEVEKWRLSVGAIILPRTKGWGFVKWLSRRMCLLPSLRT